MRSTTLRLRKISIGCDRPGHTYGRAYIAALRIAVRHGWTAPVANRSACGCLRLFRTRAEAEADQVRFIAERDAAFAQAVARLVRPRGTAVH